MMWILPWGKSECADVLENSVFEFVPSKIQDFPPRFTGNIGGKKQLTVHSLNSPSHRSPQREIVFEKARKQLYRIVLYLHCIINDDDLPSLLDASVE